MSRRQPLPRLWLMTDERADDLLDAALRRLPRGAGIVFRHYATPLPQRKRRYDAVRRVARARRLLLVLADHPRKAAAWRADGVHGRQLSHGGSRCLLRTAPVHCLKELIAARRAGVDLLFISPVFTTRSHPAGRTLGRRGFAKLARTAAGQAIALGGMDAARYRRLVPLDASGWAAIDALTCPRDQKRNVVPR